MYQVRRVHIGKTDQLDELAHACGELYTQTLVFFWRTVRHKGIWLKPKSLFEKVDPSVPDGGQEEKHKLMKPQSILKTQPIAGKSKRVTVVDSKTSTFQTASKHLMRLFTSGKLHAHTSDACVQAFFASMKSWRERRKTDPDAKPPRRRKWYFRIEYKDTAIRLKDGKLTLSNGRGNDPLVLDWQWELPKTVVIHWTGTQYEAIATYKIEKAECMPVGGEVAGIDLGEIHMAVSHDGKHTHIVNGRHLRAKRQYQNKLKEHLSKKIDRKKKGSKRRKKLVKSKQKQLRKLRNQIKDIEHKQTTRLVSTLYHEGVQTVVIGDVRDLRQNVDVGSKNNQKIHQWSHGSVRHKLTYKAERLGMVVELQDEHHTSKTCPVCEHRRKSSPNGRVFTCTNKKCKWQYHRDGVGAINIRRKYLDCGPVVGVMAPPTGMRFQSHTRVARLAIGEKFDPDNREEAAMALA